MSPSSDPGESQHGSRAWILLPTPTPSMASQRGPLRMPFPARTPGHSGLRPQEHDWREGSSDGVCVCGGGGCTWGRMRAQKDLECLGGSLARTPRCHGLECDHKPRLGRETPITQEVTAGNEPGGPSPHAWPPESLCLPHHRGVGPPSAGREPGVH